MPGSEVTTKQVPAVVLGGTGASLSITRSLGRAGVPVHVLGTDPVSPARASRYCTSFVAVGREDGVAGRWLDWLVTSAPAGAVVLPTSDEGVELVVRHQQELQERGFRLLDYAGETSLAMLDKDRTYELARQVGVDCPRTWRVRDEDDLRSLRDELSYPCALKPVQSHLFAKHFNKRKVLIANDYGELSAGLARTKQLGLDMIVTDIITGPDHFNWAFRTYIDSTGQPLFNVTTNRLRSGPIHFGTNCYLVTRWNAEVAEVGLRFMQGIGLRGLAYVELKRDARDGRLKLIECNHRFGAAQEVVRRAGIDATLIAYRRALGLPTPPEDSWREGVRLWFPLRDFRAAREYRRHGELTWGRWLLSILRPRVYVPVLARDDLGPSVYNLRIRVSRVLRRRLDGALGLVASTSASLPAQRIIESGLGI